MTQHPSGPAPTREQVLERAVGIASAVIVGLRPDHTIFEWNPAAEALYGVSRSDALGRSYLDTFIAPEQRDGVAADIRKVLGGTPTVGYQDDSLRPDGSRRTLVWNVDRVLAPDGTPWGIVAIGHDITDRLREQALFRLVFDNSADGLVVGNEHGVIDANPAALALLGLTDRSQLIGRSAAEFSPPVQPDGEPSMAKARRLGTQTKRDGWLRFEWMHRHADGREIPVDVTVRRALLGEKAISVATWHDLSRARALEAERAALGERLATARKLEAVAHLAGGIAHDFNNLLTALRGSVELARMALDDATPVAQELDLALSVADRAAALTRQLLVVGRRAAPVTPVVVDLAVVVRDALEIARRSMPPSVHFDVGLPSVPATVRGDVGQLEQVVLNLVLNARDAMPEGGVITVEVEVRDGEVLLRIMDGGIGMDEATRARIFEPFFSTKPVAHGTGLGLSVVWGIVSAAGGRIDVCTTPGAGSTFTIALPHAGDALPTAPHVGTPAPADAEGLVLLVEDEAQVRSVARRMLERAGYEVLEARHGADALEVLQRVGSRVAVVVTDVRMPELDGIALAARLAAEHPALPVVFVSGYDRTGLDGESALPEGATIVEKPFTREALLAAVREARRQGASARGGG